MNRKGNTGLTILLALSAGLICASLTALLMDGYYSGKQFQMLDMVCRGITKRRPDAESAVMEVLKESRGGLEIHTEAGYLKALGYTPSDFLAFPQRYGQVFAAAGFLVGALLLLAVFWYLRRRETLHIKALTGYLEQVNAGGQGLLLTVSEDEFSRLQDEMYKTVTALYQARDGALEAKNNFADNLSNIAHQLKTPITAISLLTQMMVQEPSPKYPAQIKKQLNRLTYLEESLLLLSRIDAGTLALEAAPVDLFTLLSLASDNLQELSDQAGVTIDIPEMGEINITVDLDWTMEAIMNLFKNCMEHAPAGTRVHCSYGKNPLYAQIQIWDEGEGFEKEELRHLFERFYRGNHAKAGGIGIGLPLAKAIIEMQNGMLSAMNHPQGGACFEIRFYSH